MILEPVGCLKLIARDFLFLESSNQGSVKLV